MSTKLNQSINCRANTGTTPSWFTVAIANAAYPFSIGKLRMLGGRGIWELFFWYSLNDSKGELAVTIPGQKIVDLNESDAAATKARLAMLNGQMVVQLLFPGRNGWWPLGELSIECDGMLELNEDPGPENEPQVILSEVSL